MHGRGTSRSESLQEAITLGDLGVGGGIPLHWSVRKQSV
jgi:hypothetical protein